MAANGACPRRCELRSRVYVLVPLYTKPADINGTGIKHLTPPALLSLAHRHPLSLPFTRLFPINSSRALQTASRDVQLEILDQNVEAGAVISLYRCGPMVDLCRGPHVPNTSVLKAQAVTNASRAFWRGDTSKDGLQRVYGITYPDKKQLAAYQRRIEEAKKRDHRVVGTQQDLFFFHQLSPGSCFFMPHGARIYQSLIAFIRARPLIYV